MLELQSVTLPIVLSVSAEVEGAVTGGSVETVTLEVSPSWQTVWFERKSAAIFWVLFLCLVDDPSFHERASSLSSETKNVAVDSSAPAVPDASGSLAFVWATRERR